MVKRLRHRPLTAVTRVRFPVGSPKSAAHLCGAFLFVSAASFAKKTPLTFADKPTIIRLACSEGKSFVGNDGLDKAQAETPVLIQPFLRFWGKPALRPAAQAAHPKAWRQFYEFPDGQHSAHLLQIPHRRLRQRPDLVHLRRGGRGHGGPVPGPSGTAALAALTWAGVVFFDRQLLTLFSAEETLLPVATGAGSIWFAMPITKLVVAVFVAVQMRSVSLC